jgi:peptidoglycan/LPS O-acetylase OafA/YrhL
MRKHLPELDIFRAFFAWWVVANHCITENWALDIKVISARHIGFIEYVLRHGGWAVDGFIILSGFVIAKLIVEGKESYLPYITRRFFRLYPVFIVCLLPSIFLLNPLSFNLWFWKAFLSHLLLIHGAIPEAFIHNSALAILPPAWSLSLEWQYYLIAPFFVSFLWAAPKRTWYLVAVGICFLYGIFRFFGNVWPYGSFLPIKIALFFIGVICYRRWPSGWNYQIPKWTAPFQWLGKVSYSTYLIHWPIIVVTYLCCKSWLQNFSFLGGSAIIFCIAAPLTLLFSALLYYCIEKPGMSFGKLMARRLGNAKIPNVSGPAFFPSLLRDRSLPGHYRTARKR